MRTCERLCWATWWACKAPQPSKAGGLIAWDRPRRQQERSLICPGQDRRSFDTPSSLSSSAAWASSPLHGVGAQVAHISVLHCRCTASSAVVAAPAVATVLSVQCAPGRAEERTATIGKDCRSRQTRGSSDDSWCKNDHPCPVTVPFDAAGAAYSFQRDIWRVNPRPLTVGAAL
jgi:hypothetical protein